MAKRSRSDSAQSEAGASHRPRTRSSGFRLATIPTQQQTTRTSRIITLKPNRRRARKDDRRQKTPPSETPLNGAPIETGDLNEDSNENSLINCFLGDDAPEFGPPGISEDVPPAVSPNKPKRVRDNTTSVMPTVP